MKKIFLFACLLCFAVLSACKKDPENKQVEVPSNLVYTPKTQQIVVGTAASSVKPTYAGTDPVSFAIEVSPTTQAISINADGTINAAANLPEGTYTINVTASNAAGSVTFPNAYQWVVAKAASKVTALTYTDASYDMVAGDTFLIPSPQITGTAPVGFVLNTVPAAGNKILITASGAIRVLPDLPAGTYKISITATNAGGTTTFADIITLNAQSVKPSGLVYSPNTLDVMFGSPATSVLPVLTGSKPVSYTLTSNPSSPLITINSEGRVLVDNGIQLGTYKVSVTATNSAGSTTFADVLTVDVQNVATLPFNFSYTPNTLILNQGQTASSSVPTLSGTLPVTFALTTAPAAGSNISINPQTGAINVGATASPGTYKVSVQATNKAGTATFADAFTITVVPTSKPFNLVYTPNTLNVLQGSTAISELPTVGGTTPMSFIVESTTPTTSGITIGADGKISVSSSVPAGTYSVSVKATNAIGSTSFPAVYTVNVNAPLVSFATDVRPIIQNRCGNCHGNYTNYNIASAKVDAFITRIQLPITNNLAMPKGGPMLSTAQIDLIKQWKAGGLKP